MKQAYLAQPGEMIIRDQALPEAGPGEIVLRVDHVGICGSDIHAFYGRHPFIALPIVLGHEATGVVSEVGADVSRIHVGDHVVIEPTLSCGQCERCRIERAHVCDHLRVVGCQFPGAYAEYVVIPEKNVVILPQDVPLKGAALIEPLAVGVRACKRGDVKDGSQVCIVGSGTIGIMTAIAARALGAQRIVLMDVNPQKCEIAKRLGFESFCNANADPRSAMELHFGQKGPDTVLECVGVEGSVRFALLGASKGGTIVIVGVFEQDVSVPMALVQDRELAVIGTLMYTEDDFADAVRLVVEGKVPTESLITRVFPLEEAAEAFAFIRDQKGAAIKVLLKP